MLSLAVDCQRRRSDGMTPSKLAPKTCSSSGVVPWIRMRRMSSDRLRSGAWGSTPNCSQNCSACGGAVLAERPDLSEAAARVPGGDLDRDGSPVDHRRGALDADLLRMPAMDEPERLHAPTLQEG